jgi:hypothetical protein
LGEKGWVTAFTNIGASFGSAEFRPPRASGDVPLVAERPDSVDFNSVEVISSIVRVIGVGVEMEIAHGVALRGGLRNGPAVWVAARLGCD